MADVRAAPAPGSAARAPQAGVDPFAALARAEERAAFLADAARRVSGSLDLVQTCRQGVRVCVPRLADWVQLLIVEDSRARVTYLRADQAQPTEAELAAPVPALSGVGRVLATGRSELLHVDGAADGLDGLAALVPDGAMRQQVNVLRPADVLGVALTARGQTFGTLTLVRRAGSGFADVDVRLAEEVAAQLALALDAARRYRERWLVASVLQDSLRPPRLPAIPGTRLASRYRSGDTGTDIGGDFYDLWSTGTGWSVVLGDVSGKGVAAAVVTGQARHTVRGAAHLDPSPAAVLDALNTQLVAGGSGRFVTAVYGHAVAHPDGGWELELGSAGHPPPLLLRPDGTVEPVPVKGLLAGVVAGAAYTPARLRLVPGDTLLLYTDGVTEAGRDQATGVARLTRLVAGYATAPVEALVEAVEMDAVERAGRRRPDDLAVVAVRVLA
jgi:serine phosphatase RsbU (regulator of sigma subunit)